MNLFCNYYSCAPESLVDPADDGRIVFRNDHWISEFPSLAKEGWREAPG
jgi:hypothetical protein